MKTKQIILGLALLAISAISFKAFSFSRLNKEEKIKHITEKMAKKLSLTEEQKTKVFQINLERANGHEEAYKQGRKKEVIYAAVAKWQAELKQVLTTEQAQKLRIN
ncbi:Spy/CpxP family protein refolding chaperone [Runella defluvii]|uniref:Spy/CpxP family protein refolding chaperone n=1 Tax=Runella defluvii TaxID=370973 RepID=A0A7W6ENK6_9BACT|nr:hypothetical protein [Runella defluvii]MBB3836518.1 Spy/CpxP family protein refolding chaperone [Runella defluvii]